MKVHIIYHKEDLDGKSSASIIQYFLPEGTEINFLPYNYEEDYGFLDEIPDSSIVYQVDCSFPNEIIEKLMKRVDFIWIDHHQSAVDRIKGTEIEECKGLRVIGKAACELTWEWCAKNLSKDNKPVPAVIKYLGRKDVWDQSFFPRVMYLDVSLNSLDLDPSEENRPKWKLLLEASEEDLEANVERGKKIWKYLTRTWSNELPKMAIKLLFGSQKKYYKVVCSNHDKGSCFFDDYEEEHDFKMAFWIESDCMIHYSLYCDKEGLDMVKACEIMGENGKYGSFGGHAKAASFMSDKLPWDLPEVALEDDPQEEN